MSTFMSRDVTVEVDFFTAQGWVNYCGGVVVVGHSDLTIEIAAVLLGGPNKDFVTVPPADYGEEEFVELVGSNTFISLTVDPVRCEWDDLSIVCDDMRVAAALRKDPVKLARLYRMADRVFAEWVKNHSEDLEFHNPTSIAAGHEAYSRLRERVANP